jgi:NOL1/NOP2/sun family putative RNA methylase
MHNEFIKRLGEIVPKESYNAILNSFSLERDVTVRTNTLRSNITELTTALETLDIPYTTISWHPDALTIPHSLKSTLSMSDFYNEGYAYIQSQASLLPALVLAPQKGDEVLDLCAAPGSKTSQMAAMMHNEGRIGAVEKSKNRFFKLKSNLERLGVRSVDTYLKDGSTVWRSCENRFDKVLVDAPCSSEGRFDTHNPETLRYWTPNKIKQMARMQWQLLQSGFRSLKPGGTLVYSTCTFAPEENELIVHRLLKRFSNARILKMHLPITNVQAGLSAWQGKALNPQIAQCLRILPNDAMPSFFLCYLQKTETGQ